MGQTESYEELDKPDYYNTCKNEYIDFINNDKNTDIIIKCNKYFEIISGNKFQVTDIDTHIGKCKLINNKKKDKYTYTYDISKIIENIKNNEDNLPENYLINFNDLFDNKIRYNCCNCVSIVLYSKGDATNLSTYLPYILVSLKNIEKYLPNWVYRLYLDFSVLELIAYEYNKVDSNCNNFSFGCEYNKLFKQIIDHPNCEIYIPLCESIFTGEQKLNINFTRSLRFIGFIDEDVNINVSRDADGIISAFDCHNLKIFEQKPLIMFIYPFLVNDNGKYITSFNHFSNKRYTTIDDISINEDYEKKNTNENAEKKIDMIYDYPYYPAWINIYNELNILNKMDNESLLNYKMSKCPITTLLAGLTALKCKIKKMFLLKKVRILLKILIIILRKYIINITIKIIIYLLLQIN
jgi:hypothetical protein